MFDDLFGFLMPAIWGFLVGFVGWGACFRLIEQITTWLTEAPGVHAVVGVARIVVMLFLVGAVLFLLVLMPVFLSASGRLELGDDTRWRSVFGVTFMASMAGVFALGIVRRVLHSSAGR
jgi:hypothetical protein